MSGTNPPITRMEMIMIEQAEIQNGRMVDYHKWVIQFAEQMITRFPGGDPVCLHLFMLPLILSF